MKYIKEYELTEFEENNVIYSLARNIKSFMELYLGLISIKYHPNSVSFWYAIKYSRLIFTIQEIDYYYGDVDEYFEFNLNTNVKNVNYTGQKTYDVIMFIEYIMSKYRDFQNLIKYSNIDNIIKDLSQENYEVFIEKSKYNL